MKKMQATVMVVDDTPENLELLNGMLRQKGYRVLTFPRGDLALKAAAKNPPDLILLDIMMPGMDGFEVCERLKADESLKRIPVIFISALSETMDKVKAFSVGGVDYVTKPFQFEEVMARVNVHLELRRQRDEISELLRGTLVGAVKALNELLVIASPDTYRVTLKVTQHIRNMSAKMRVEDSWRLEIAAMLSNLGNLVPFGTDNSSSDIAGYLGFEKSALREASRIIGYIPRLEAIASIVEMAADPPPGDLDYQSWQDEVLGAQLLRVAVGFEERMEKGMTAPAAFKEMRQLPEHFHPRLLEILEQVVPWRGTDEVIGFATGMEFEDVSLDELQVGDILAQDLVTSSELKILSKGTELTFNLCSLIEKYTNLSPIIFPVHILRKKESKMV